MKKKSLYAIGGILLLFIITNPSASAFKEYIGSSSYQGLKRTNQFFVCSVYKASGSEYFGIIGNFIKVESKKMQEPVVIQPPVDTTLMTDTSKKQMDTSNGVPPLPKGFVPNKK